MKIVMAKTAVDFRAERDLRGLSGGRFLRIDHGENRRARGGAFACKSTHGHGGLILLDRHDNPGFVFNTPRMAYGYVALDGNLVRSV